MDSAAVSIGMKISVVMPVYNEIKTIQEIIRRVIATALVSEIVIVDDGSSDGTTEYLKKLGGDRNRTKDIKILFHSRNMGKGAAIRTALGCVTGDIIIIQDADLEYDPAEYGKALEAIMDGRADVVYGSRFLAGPHRVLLFWHYLGNKLVTFFSNILNNLNLTDMETGFKIFKKDFLKDIQIKSDRFGFEPEVTAKIAKKRCKIYEVPVSYSGRDYSEGKKITWKDGLKAIFYIIKFRFMD